MSESRFRFGENWLRLVRELSERQILEADSSLKALLDVENLNGRTFLDIGSGSGLFSLAARKLGARVHSFDYDAQSVESTALLRGKYFPSDPQWTVERGSILNREYISRLGKFDIVYSWGVLHHTGAMHDAIRNAASLVGADGLFAFALYKRTGFCWAWKWEKKWYAGASPKAQERAMTLYLALIRAAFRVRGRNFDDYVREYAPGRGMNFYRDVHDWLGGFPYESIRPSEVASLMKLLGFSPVRAHVHPSFIGLFGSTCDEYVYARK